MSIPAFSDISIVGGGPAGLAAAIAFSQKGFAATVVDCAIPPIDKACGEGLMPDSVAVLQQLGVTLPAGIGYRFRGIRFCDENSTVTANFPVGFGVGLRRTALHQILIRRAEECNVNLNWGVKHVDLAGCGISVDGELIASKFVVGADGQNSRIRTQSGLHRVRGEQRRYGFRRHYRLAPWSDYVELYWGRTCQIYITPVAPDEVCVALISRDPKLRLDAALREFPMVREHLASASVVSSEMGALSISRTLRRVVLPGLALVGDASGSVDAVTGEGMCLAFRQALALATALETKNLPGYESAHRSIYWRPRAMAWLMLRLDAHRGFQRRALAALAQRPGVFASLLGIHVGEQSFADLLSWQLVGFCRAFLSA